MVNKKKKNVDLHKQLWEHTQAILKLIGIFLQNGVRLSSLRHRGDPCQKCKRPVANNLAREELITDGDGPDLCWGYCAFKESDGE